MDSSSYDIAVTPEAQFLRMTVAGEFSVARTLNAFSRVSEEAARHAAGRVLLDARGVTGIASDSQQYEVGRHFPAHVHVKVALVDAPERRSYFGEWVAVSGGAHVRLFADEARALAWLLDATR